MGNKFRGNIDQWTTFTIITMYNSYFKPMDNGSMITWPMGGKGQLFRDPYKTPSTERVNARLESCQSTTEFMCMGS
jgi:hypothetical protein